MGCANSFEPIPDGALSSSFSKRDVAMTDAAISVRA